MYKLNSRCSQCESRTGYMADPSNSIQPPLRHCASILDAFRVTKKTPSQRFRYQFSQCCRPYTNERRSFAVRHSTAQVAFRLFRNSPPNPTQGLPGLEPESSVNFSLRYPSFPVKYDDFSTRVLSKYVETSLDQTLSS